MRSTGRHAIWQAIAVSAVVTGTICVFAIVEHFSGWPGRPAFGIARSLAQ